MKKYILIFVAILCCFSSVCWAEESAERHFQRGSDFARQGIFNKAALEFEQVIQLDPNYPEIYSYLGSAYVQIGNLEKASEAFKNALESNPGNILSLTFLGNIYFQKGKLRQAEDKLKTALELKRDNPQALIGLVNIYAEFFSEIDLKPVA